MAKKQQDTPTLFSEQGFAPENLQDASSAPAGPVTCLGMEFENDDARRAYFREELRKKLPELRHIEGFPIGEDDDIINLSDPPYYTACPNPWLKDFIQEWEQEKVQLAAEGKRSEEFEVKEPYASDISVGKNNPIYNAHSYHTKVPHPAIMRLLYHYSQPGDIVYDGFAGTGMTGVAAGMCGSGSKDAPTQSNKIGKRHCICNDLSPIASYISYNINNNTSKDLGSFPKILEELESEYSYMYKTKHEKDKYGDIFFMVWSDEIVCDNCAGETPFMDLFCRIGKGVIEDTAICPHCGSTIKRNSCKKKKETYFDSRVNKTFSRVVSNPYLIVYYYGGHKYRKRPDDEDLELIDRIRKTNNTSWVPIVELGEGDKMEDPKAKGIFYVHQLYSDRTLFLLSKLWERSSVQNRFFITTSIARNLTKLNRFILNKYHMNGRINGPLTGTLYVPSEVVEQNIFDLLRVKQSEIDTIGFNNAIQVGDALHNEMMPNSSVDYIFTDPPFGDNIMYSELNRISEAWLGVITNNTDEAISNKTQHKSSTDYMQLMSDAFADYYRILKPGKWMTVEFSNTKASIWNAIQNAIQSSGFVIATVTAFDKVHGGFKSMRYTTSVKEDLIITCFKPSEGLIESFVPNQNNSRNVWELIGELLEHLPVHVLKGNSTTAIIERSPKILFDRLIAYYVQQGYPVPMDAQEFQVGLRERFLEIDGMFFTAQQASEYQEKKKLAPEFVPMGLVVSDEANGIEWLKRELKEPKTYQEIQPEWMQAIGAVRKNDIIPELKQLLDENFIEEDNGKWRLPNIQDDKDVNALRTKALLREFKIYVEAASKPKAKIKQARVEALRAGFKDCYVKKDFQTIVTVGDKIPQNLRDEDEVLLQFYDIALNKL